MTGMTGLHDDMVANPVMYCPAVARAGTQKGLIYIE